MEEHEVKKSETQESQHGTLREAFRSGTPDEVRDRVKETVQKGVAAVAGALKGFTDETRKERISEATSGAIHEAGDTISKAAREIGEGAQKLKEPLKDAGQKLRETARDVRSSASEEISRTREAVRRGGSAPSPMEQEGFSRSRTMPFVPPGEPRSIADLEREAEEKE